MLSTRPNRFLGLMVMALLLLSGSQTLANLTAPSSSQSTAFASPLGSNSSYGMAPFAGTQAASTYGTGLSGAPVVLDINTLSQMEGSAGIAGMEAYINEYFVPVGIHLVFLDPLWNNDANTTTTMVAGGYQGVVADWLSLGVKYHINTIFFVKQFGYFFSSPSWDQDFINAYPSAATVNSNGVSVPLVNCSGCTTSSGWTIASPLVYRQYEDDLKQMWTWYGQYPSWIGIGEGATGDRNNYGSIGTAIKTSRPFDNFTLYTYANSIFFQRNINSASGQYADSTVSKIWAMFVNDRPDVFASTGLAEVNPSTWSIYGTSAILQRFYVPFGQTLNGFKLSAYLQAVGAVTKPLYETIYRDNASAIIGRPDLALVLENESVSGVGTSAGWVSTSFTSTLEGGDYYWVAFTTHGGDASDYYSVSYLQSNVFQDIYPYATTGGGVQGAVAKAGGSILWLTNNASETVTVYPYLQEGNNWPSIESTQFQVTQTEKMNEISLFTSDRAYDPNNITITISYPNGTQLNSGQLSVQALHGSEGLSYAPVQLSPIVTLEPGITYTVSFSPAPSGDDYAGSLGGGITQDLITSSANPPSAGYLGQATWPIFSLGLMNLEPEGVSNSEYISQTDLFSSPGYVAGSEIALRFKPSQTESLQTFSLEVLKVPSNSDLLNVTLRTDNETCQTGGNTGCSHPMSPSHTPVMAQGNEAFSAINATFRSGSTWSGAYAWANFTMRAQPHGSLTLTAGTWYWLVISATNGGYPILQRDVNPTSALVYYSASDYKSSWGPPPDGPTDLSYKITTSQQVLGQLAEQQPNIQLGWAAQSFESPTAFQLKGLWVQTSTSGVYDISVSVRPDSGSDSPSSTVLTSGTIPSNSSSNTLNYVSFSLPVNVTANREYWFTLDAYCQQAGTCSSLAKTYAIVYRSDGRSTVRHYDTSVDGVSWSSAPLGGSLNFVLAASTSTIKTYNTKTLYQEIVSENDQSTANIPAQGWNAFLGSEQSGLMSKLTMLLTGLTGHRAMWYTGLPANVAKTSPFFSAGSTVYADSGAGGTIGCPPSQASCGGTTTFWAGDGEEHTIDILSAPNQTNWLPWSSFGSTDDNRGDLRPVDIRNEYLFGVPLTARSIVSFNDWSYSVQYKGIENMTQVQPAQQFGTLLNRMQANGGYYGTESNTVRVLWIGSSDDGLFPQYLTPALNVTFVSNNYPDQNLTYLGNLNQFNVIVGGLQNPTPSFSARLSDFIYNGGGYIGTSFGSSSGSSDAFLGLQSSASAASVGGSLSIVKPNKITSPYTSIYYNPYWLRYTISNMTGQANPAYVLLKDDHGNPLITTHAFGSGIGVSLEQPYARLQFSGNSHSYNGVQFGSPRDSWVSLMINAIYYAAHKGNMLPILWESSYNQQQSWSPYLQFSVDGSPGKPVLVWASNNDTVSSSFDIHLNATYYGINPGGWMALNMQNMSVVATGTGADIHLDATVPPMSWMPIYIMSTGSDLQPVYSTASIVTSSQGSGAATFGLQGPFNASAWVVMGASSPPVSVTVDGWSLAQNPSVSSLNKTSIGYSCTSVVAGGGCSSFKSLDQQGWAYDSANHLLYVHLALGGAPTTSMSITESGGSFNSVTTTSSTTTTSTSTTTFTTSSSTHTSTTSRTSSATSTTTSTPTTSSTASSTSTSTTTSSATTQSASGSMSVAISGPATANSGQLSQYLAVITVSNGSPLGVNVNWYVDGNLVWSEGAGPSGSGGSVGWAWFNEYWTTGTHTIRAVVGSGVQSNSLTVIASSSSST
ncbi:MAG: hypothetical protein OK455_10220, partial [Thaumarchaeota archaeon]|nr:hypothetical protein [Nitrososphaerota archaeon]